MRKVRVVRKITVPVTASMSSLSNVSRAPPGRKPGELYPFPKFRGQLNHRFNSMPPMRFSSSNRSGICTLSVSSLHSSYNDFDHARSKYQYYRPRRRPQLQSQLRSYSSGTDDHTDEKNRNGISADGAGILLLEKVAFAAKEIVEVRVVQSIETAVWKSSTQTERKKMCRFFFPQLRKATNDLLGVTRDIDSLSHSIEEVRRENKGCNTTGERFLRELHGSFLHLTQIVLDNFDVAMELEGDQNDNSQNNSVHSLQMVELVLALSYRAHKLGLGYHLPLYKRLGIVVAKHPKIVEEKIPLGAMTTLGSLASHSRAEIIQTIHRWSRSTWDSSSNDTGENQTNDNEGQILKSKHEDLKWFHPSLKVLAADGRWPDVYHILLGLFRPNPDPISAEGDYVSDSVDGREDNYVCDDFDDPIVLTSATILPYLDEDLVFDLLVPMNRQGLIRVMRDNSGRHLPSMSAEENIIIMMEASIWKIFSTIPSHLKSTIRHENKDYREIYSLQDAIGILLKCGPMNFNVGNKIDDDEGGEYSSNGEEEDSLAKALKELEDLVDGLIDVGKDGEGENDEIDQQASDAIALATAFSNQIRHEGAQDNQNNDCGDLNFLNPKSITVPSDKTEVRTGRSYSEHIKEMTNLNKVSRQSTESYLRSVEGEEYLDFIYDDRAVDYEDNLPDITKQIYQNNGNQQLRYSTSLEYHIYEGLQRSNLHYDSEDGEDDIEF